MKFFIFIFICLFIGCNFSKDIERVQRKPFIKIDSHINLYSIVYEDQYWEINSKTKDSKIIQDDGFVILKRYGNYREDAYYNSDSSPRVGKKGYHRGFSFNDTFYKTEQYFDTKNRLINNRDGYAATEGVYDPIFNTFELKILDQNRRLVNDKSGRAILKEAYIKKNHWIGTQYDKNGNPVPFAGIYSIECINDDAGNMIDRKGFLKDGKLKFRIQKIYDPLRKDWKIKTCYWNPEKNEYEKNEKYENEEEVEEEMESL